jgi:hypothetical protein
MRRSNFRITRRPSAAGDPERSETKTQHARLTADPPVYSLYSQQGGGHADEDSEVG